jgi:hypothetical protein
MRCLHARPIWLTFELIRYLQGGRKVFVKAAA